MAQVINTNIASLNAQRNLNTSQASLATSLERLSSGLRINSAKDDAAGLAITERFTTQIRGLNQAIRNANDGISLSQTAEGALGELSNNLQRIRELAIQSANATNSDSDRAALDLEVQQRLEEVDRIAAQTSFNGRKILDGTFGDAAFQVGANVGETIDLNLETSIRTNSIGAIAQATSVDLSAIDGTEAVPNTSGISGTFADVSLANTEVFSLTVGAVSIFSLTGDADGETVTAADIDGANGLGNATVQSNLASAGFTVSGSAANGDLAFTREDGATFNISVVNDGTGAGFSGNDFLAGSNPVDNGEEAVAPTPLTITELTIQLGEADPITIPADTYASFEDLVDAVTTAISGNATVQVDDDNASFTIVSDEAVVIDGADQAAVFTATNYAVDGSLSDIDILDVEGANDTIYRVDAALTSVSDLRSTFGAIQNRFESTIANLGSTVENLSASRSRIQDADFAAETANLTRAQILQQAGTTILAQANALPQNVLTLLG